MEIRKNYKENNHLRESFNELANKIFCINFENWYQNGYWNENYIPYSVVIDEKVVANENLIVYQIFAKEKPLIDDVIKAFGPNIKRVVLGFVPDEKERYECNLY